MTIFENEEDDMHSTFREVMEERLENAFGEYLYHEIKTDNRCRADFVKTEVDVDRAWERVVHYGHDEPVPDDSWSMIRVAENHCPLPKEELISRPAGSEENHELFEWFVENNYLLEDSDGWYHFQYPPHVLRSASVYELKLHKWEKGLRQAKNYRSKIAWYAHVVIDADRISAAVKNLDQFKDENVGLMALSRDSLEVIYEPDRMRRHTPSKTGRIRNLSEWSFRDFLEEHPPREYDRTPADDIGEHQNPYKATKTSLELEDAFADEHVPEW